MTFCLGIVDGNLPRRARSPTRQHLGKESTLRIVVGQLQIAGCGVIHRAGSLGGKIVEKRPGQGKVGFPFAVKNQFPGKGCIAAAQTFELVGNGGQVAGLENNLNIAVCVIGSGQSRKSHQLGKGVDLVGVADFFGNLRLRGEQRQGKLRLRRLRGLLGGLGRLCLGCGFGRLRRLGGFFQNRRRLRLHSGRRRRGLGRSRNRFGGLFRRFFRRLIFLAHLGGRRRSILLPVNRQHNYIQKQTCRQHQRSQSDSSVHCLAFLSGKCVLEQHCLILNSN